MALAPGEVLFEAGAVGDRFYVVSAGSVEILDRGRLVRTMGVGEGFGEIALLGRCTRTMTVRASDAGPSSCTPSAAGSSSPP